MALISRDTVSRRVLMREASSDWLGGERMMARLGSSRSGTGEAQQFRVDAAADIERAEFADPTGHRAIARDQRRDDGFAERTVGEHRVDEHRARHFRDRRVVDREHAERTVTPVESGQFAKERARLHVREDEVLPHPMSHRPETPGHDEIDVTVVRGLTDEPLAHRRLEPNAMTIQNPAGFRYRAS